MRREFLPQEILDNITLPAKPRFQKLDSFAFTTHHDRRLAKVLLACPIGEITRYATLTELQCLLDVGHAMAIRKDRIPVGSEVRKLIWELFNKMIQERTK